MVKFRKPYDNHQFVGETTELPSKTEDNGSLSIRQLVARLIGGTQIMSASAGTYPQEDASFDDITPMDYSDFDLTDAKQMADAANAKVLSARELKAKEKADAAAAQAKKLADDLAELELLRKNKA